MTIKNTNPVFFVTPNPNRAVGLEKIIKNYYVICSQKTDLVSYFKKEKIPVLCLNNDEIKNSGKILANKKVIKYIEEKSKGKTANVITFKPSPMIQKICDENNFKYLGNDWKLNRKLEDKIEFVGITNKLKIPNAESKIIKVEENNFSPLRQSLSAEDSDEKTRDSLESSAERLQRGGKDNLFEYNVKIKKGKKFIAQLSRGFSGKTTFLIESEKDLDNIIKKYLGRKIKLAKYLEGETWTINACVSKSGVAISQPIFQITGLTSYNKNKFGTSGNDYKYGEKLGSEENKKIFDFTKKVGDYFKRLKYKGIFGLDFIINNNSEVNLIEINPRLVASIPVFTKLQIQNKEKPFLLSHISEFMGNLTSPGLSLSGGENFSASQLILRNTKDKPIKIIKNLKSGIYEIKKGKLIFKEKAYYLNRNLKENEFLIQCAAKNSVINSDMEYANIQVNYGIMEDRKRFKRCFNSVVKTVLKNVKLL